MKLIIEDLSAEDFKSICPLALKDIQVITNEEGRIAHCIGCFGCWVKSPGVCVINDGYDLMGPAFAASEELILITKIQYGGYSPFIKNVLDRSIGFMLPFFTIRKNEMHHQDRYSDRMKMTVIGYGENVTPEEKTTFKGIVAANALNFNPEGYRAIIVDTKEDITKVLEALQ